MAAMVGVKIDTIHVIDLIFNICSDTRTIGKNVPAAAPSLPINYSAREEREEKKTIMNKR